MMILLQDPIIQCCVILSVAVLLDFLIGDPVYPFHPVRLIGNTIQKIESLLFYLGLSGFGGGLLLLGSMYFLFLSGYNLLSFLPEPLVWGIDVFLIYSCIAAKDLQVHGKRIYDALQLPNLSQARNAVQMIVGRDAKQLNEAGVIRAGIESVAENFVDGFFSPIFFFMMGAWFHSFLNLSPLEGGMYWIIAYRITNTLDSMVGYRNLRYEFFGKASAKVDDWMNWIPARLGIPLITLASLMKRGNASQAWKIGWRDRFQHKSPNAGHTESAVAGALGIKLGGPVIYPFGTVEKPWMGEVESDLTPEHLKMAMQLIHQAAILSVILVISTMLFLF
ncbi:MAG: cobalamin biosynthesis protein CobD [SAR324 cluster bacterium]|uniref:Cobalamin biosynthesis protein CobD n=1 Tax=SAR324 cluster bacterium TaxID=2024889 RepID=A0A2A4T5X3_9DELT|nr:MAG: cobalamin biosynthesis protein CobD [SAR324 cluster bacterium]